MDRIQITNSITVLLIIKFLEINDIIYRMSNTECKINNGCSAARRRHTTDAAFTLNFYGDASTSRGYEAVQGACVFAGRRVGWRSTGCDEQEDERQGQNAEYSVQRVFSVHHALVYNWYILKRRDSGWTDLIG